MRKIVCVVGDTNYFVRPTSIRGFFLHGDRVNIRITRSASGGKMPEGDILSLVHRSHESVLVQVILKWNQKYLQVLSQYGRWEERFHSEDREYSFWDILMVRFFQNGTYKILQKFATIEDADLEEKILLAVHRVRQVFSEEVLATRPIKKTIPSYLVGDTIVSSTSLSHFLKEFHFEDIEDIPLIYPESKMLQTYEDRIDCRNWFTFTIDGADARDLDDALSLARYANGDTLLAVHIADVAEYVTEASPLDREALIRSTSIYTPGKVIPMLPEYLSNDLCSLHPGEAKFALTCFMRLNTKWIVIYADIRETLIQSHHRWVYDDLYVHFQTCQDDGASLLDKSLKYAYTLYEIMRERRRKEWKILFESTELYFDLASSDSDISTQVQGIRKRNRNDMHMLIEEFMVLANEEVAKWCEKMELPFLSRVHGLPSVEQIQMIIRIIELKEFKKQLEPVHIRQFMDGLESTEEYFRVSRLLLPKMAKATYSDKKFRHFGLALEYYTHFTSPIRRYPDLQVHRIIKEFLHKELNDSRKIHYQKLLTKVAKKTSENERHAEEIERAFDSLFMCRYMQQFVGNSFRGIISGLTESALFIELENGTEGICFLERAIFRIDPVSGTLFSAVWKKLYQIGQSVRVRVDEVNISERRILLSFVEKS